MHLKGGSRNETLFVGPLGHGAHPGSGGRIRGTGPKARYREHRLDSDVDRSRTVHDASGPLAVLRRPRTREKRALGADAVLHHRLRRFHRLARRRLQPGVRGRQRLYRRTGQGVFRGRGRGFALGQHSRDGLRHVPAYLRHHNARSDRGQLRRADALLRPSDLLRRLGRGRLRPRGPLGVGRGMARRDGRARFRGRHRGAHQLRHRCSGGRHDDRPETRLSQHGHTAP